MHLEQLRHHHIIWIIAILTSLIALYMVNINIEEIDSLGLTSTSYTGITIPIVTDIEIHLTSLAKEFTGNEIFQQFGTAITFLYSMTPSIIPIPNEAFIIPLIIVEPDDEQLDTALYLIAITTIGGIIGDSLIFFGSKYHLHKLPIIGRKGKMSHEHFFHKYGVLVFLFSPSLWFAGGFAELPLVYAGYSQASYRHIILFVSLGNIIRGIWSGMILLLLLGLI